MKFKQIIEKPCNFNVIGLPVISKIFFIFKINFTAQHYLNTIITSWSSFICLYFEHFGVYSLVTTPLYDLS
jgi:hypothetical protein